VTHDINITTKNLNAAGKVLDLAVENGVNNVESVTFDLTDATK